VNSIAEFFLEKVWIERLNEKYKKISAVLLNLVTDTVIYHEMNKQWMTSSTLYHHFMSKTYSMLMPWSGLAYQPKVKKLKHGWGTKE